jgi:hypothetical protein
MENLKETWNLPSQLLNVVTNENLELTTVESWSVPRNILNVLRSTETTNTNHYRDSIILTIALVIPFMIILILVLIVLGKKIHKHTTSNNLVENEATNDSLTKSKQTDEQKIEENNLSWDPNGVNLTQSALENNSVDHDLLNMLKLKIVRTGEEWRQNPTIDSHGNRIAPNGKIVQICIGCHFYFVKETGLAIHQKNCTYYLNRRTSYDLVFSSSVVENNEI